MSLKISAESLFAFDRLEQRLEVALAEATRTVAFDHLEEERRPVLRGLREDLQQVSLLIAIGEDAQPAEVVPVLADLTYPLLDVDVIRIWCVEEADASFLQRLDASHDVLAQQRDVLNSGAAEKLEVFVDLAPAFPFGGL